VTRTLPINHEGTSAYCAVMFCMLGGATAIMIARMRVMEKITLSVKWSYCADVRSEGQVRTNCDTRAPHL